MPSTDTNIFITENHVYKYCSDVILMPQFLKVVRKIFQVWWVMLCIVLLQI